MARQLLMGDVIRSAAARMPNRTAIAHEDSSLTFAQLNERAEELAQRLLIAGVCRGDRIAWRAVTSVESAIVYSAAALIGAIFVPINPAYTTAEEARILGHADPKVYLQLGPGGVGIDCSNLPAPTCIVDLPEVSEDDPVAIFYTSGTTGEPKGCLLTHRSERIRAGSGEACPQGATVCMFPQFHMASWSFSLRTWLSGDAMVYVPRADAEYLLAAVSRHKANHLYCVPAVWRRILDFDRRPYDLSSLRAVDTGTSAVTVEMLRELRDVFPDCQIRVIYGSTECGMVCVLGTDHLFSKPSSVGCPAPGVEVRIDEQSQMWVRSPAVFPGYFRNEEATRAALVHDWYGTGDLAVRDSEGFYSIIGRASEIIRTGGETVAPVEVDSVLQSHPDLSDGAVAGIPHPEWGEVIVAFVVPRVGATTTLDGLREYCRRTLAPHKLPRDLVLLDKLPRTGATRQIVRSQLVSMYTLKNCEV